jgi:hypothetical protein
MAAGIQDEALACVALLREAGRDAHAEALDRSLCGSTSGEILVLMGAALKEALRDRRLPAATRSRMKALRREVDRALRPRW